MDARAGTLRRRLRTEGSGLERPRLTTRRTFDTSQVANVRRAFAPPPREAQSADAADRGHGGAALHQARAGANAYSGAMGRAAAASRATASQPTSVRPTDRPASSSA
jgi:hypothetical protein